MNIFEDSQFNELKVFHVFKTSLYLFMEIIFESTYLNMMRLQHSTYQSDSLNETLLQN